MELVLNESSLQMLTAFAIIASGYLLGSVSIKEISLGSAAIFLSGLLFGYLGADILAELQTVGLLFIISVGLSVGPSFFRRLWVNGTAYLVLCVTIELTGALVCRAVILLAGVDAPLAVGILTGAFTISPGFAAAKGLVVDSTDAVSRVAAGYGASIPSG